MINIAQIKAPLKALLRADADELGRLLRQPVTPALLAPLVIAIVIGCGMYGVAIGIWRSPLQAAYAGLKMPMLIFATLLVNGLINGMLAQVLGSGLSFRQTLMACLMCFAVFAMIVGSLSPIVIAMVLDSPPADHADGDAWYRVILLTHVLVMASAGIVSNHKLLHLLQVFSGDALVGKRTFFAWLAGNLFVGAQLSYILRPFFGNPHLQVEFLRSHPFNGNFCESVWSMFSGAVGHKFIILFTALSAVSAPFLLIVDRMRRPRIPLPHSPNPKHKP